MLAPFSIRTFWKNALAPSPVISASIRYENVPILESCLCSSPLFSTRICSSISRALWISKAFRSSSCSNGISSLFSYVREIWTSLFSSLILVVASSSCSSVHISILFKSILSAKQIYSTASFSHPSSLSSVIRLTILVPSQTVIQASK